MLTIQEQDALLFSGKTIYGTVLIENSYDWKPYRGKIVEQTEDLVTIETQYGKISAPWMSLREVSESPESELV